MPFRKENAFNVSFLKIFLHNLNAWHYPLTYKLCVTPFFFLALLWNKTHVLNTLLSKKIYDIFIYIVWWVVWSDHCDAITQVKKYKAIYLLQSPFFCPHLDPIVLIFKDITSLLSFTVLSPKYLPLNTIVWFCFVSFFFLVLYI